MRDMDNQVFKKYEKLKHIVRSYQIAGVAFSGGIDSSLLLFAAGEVLGKNNVIGIHGRSRFNADLTDIEELYSHSFSEIAQLKILDLEPLTWPDFVSNSGKRCYYCKKKTYAAFLEYLQGMNVNNLLDGTNRNDLDENRPGVRVLQELKIHTPLVKAGLGKKEIRFLARTFGLPNHGLPSNSCLATRLNFLPDIEEKTLGKVKKIELYLQKMGLLGCRARPMQDTIVIELRLQDIRKISYIHNRLRIIDFCKSEGFAKVLVDLQGRK